MSSTLSSPNATSLLVLTSCTSYLLLHYYLALAEVKSGAGRVAGGGVTAPPHPPDELITNGALLAAFCMPRLLYAELFSWSWEPILSLLCSRLGWVANGVCFKVGSRDTFEEMKAPGTLALRWLAPEMFCTFELGIDVGTAEVFFVWSRFCWSKTFNSIANYALCGIWLVAAPVAEFSAFVL